jgi:hypothetical protein
MVEIYTYFVELLLRVQLYFIIPKCFLQESFSLHLV